MPTDLPTWALAQRLAVGNRIRELRAELDVSQEQLAEEMGLDRKTVNRMETGANSASVDAFFLAARALGVTMPELFQGLPVDPERPAD